MKLSEADKLGMSPEEIAVLEAEPEPGAEGNDTTAGAQGNDTQAAAGDDTQAGAQGEDTAAAAGDDTAAGAGDDTQKGAQFTQEELDDALDDKPTIAPAVAALPTYEAGDTAAIAEQRKALRATRAEIERDWSTGKITDDERAAKLDELQDKLDDLLIQQTRAETLKSVNERNVAVQRESIEKQIDNAVGTVIQAAKGAQVEAERIDYANDAEAAEQFDTFFEAAMKTKSVVADLHAGKTTFNEIAQRAHRSVLALRGVVVGAQAPAPAPAAAAPKPPREVPKTLSGLPNAGGAIEGDENYAKFATLSGDDAERFLAGLPAKEVDRLMRLADAQALVGVR